MCMPGRTRFTQSQPPTRTAVGNFSPSLLERFNLGIKLLCLERFTERHIPNVPEAPFRVYPELVCEDQAIWRYPGVCVVGVEVLRKQPSIKGEVPGLTIVEVSEEVSSDL